MSDVDKAIPSLGWTSFYVGRMIGALMDLQKAIVEHTESNLTREGFEEIRQKAFEAKQDMDKIEDHLSQVGQYFGISNPLG